MVGMEERSIQDSLTRIVNEIEGAAALPDAPALAAAVELTADARRVFVHGAGRSGLALRMTAMRLMHLGLHVHVVGETTTPAIREGDLLLTASGSGTTPGVVSAAETARSVGARVIGITTDPESTLAQLSHAVLVIRAATKTDRSEQQSAQYAGSLFEQLLVLVGDALFDVLWQKSGQSADALWPRHANLE